MTAREYKVVFAKNGGVKIRAGTRKDVIVRLDERTLAVDPSQAAKDAIGSRKPKQVSLMVNGFRARAAQGYTLRQFYRYLEDELLPEWIRLNEERYGGKKEAVEKFADIFHLRLLY